jgi:hypothetical protein
MSSSDESDPIIAFKCEARYTNIDYRDKLALKADECLKMRSCCSLIEDEEEFQMIMIALLKSLDNLKMKSESFHEDAHAGDVLDNSSTSDSSNSSNSSYSSFSSSFKQQ